MREYTTERGVTVGVMPIPLLLEEIRKAHEAPPLPTYTEKLAGGGKQEVEITEADALAWQESDPETWKEHAEKWAAYVQVRDERQSLVNERIRDAVIRRAIVVELPEDEGWIAEHKALGLTVPKNATERRVHYIRTEVIGGVRDLIKLTALANGSDISEDALQLAEDSFRSSLARSLFEGLTGSAGGVEPGPEGGTDSDGEGVGAET